MLFSILLTQQLLSKDREGPLKGQSTAVAVPLRLVDVVFASSTFSY